MIFNNMVYFKTLQSRDLAINAKRGLFLKTAYLGPEGTFSQQAARQFCPGGDLRPYPVIEDIFGAVSNGDCQCGVVPFENTTEGAVNETLDTLLFGCPTLSINALLPLPIRHCIMARAAEPRTLTKIFSHPQSLAQCRQYIRQHFGGAETVTAASNGEAARIVSESAEPWAAIGPTGAAARYGLHIHAENIQDQANNITTFLQITKDLPARPRRGYRTSLAFSTYNKPGELYRVLGIFDVYRVNMTKILSRPMKDKPGEYVFYVDIEDYIPRDATRTLTLIKERTPFYRLLGTYTSI